MNAFWILNLIRFQFLKCKILSIFVSNEKLFSFRPFFVRLAKAKAKALFILGFLLYCLCQWFESIMYETSVPESLSAFSSGKKNRHLKIKKFHRVMSLKIRFFVFVALCMCFSSRYAMFLLLSVFFDFGFLFDLLVRCWVKCNCPEAFSW